VLINNMGIMGVDVKKVDALIVSHGHFDHYGGLSDFSTSTAACSRTT
jgi:7,8-dihydropterin-6-yl-methyl-4-(beta-D-ribofuranosyl)aminobenzene 5'-phosphate synthase